MEGLRGKCRIHMHMTGDCVFAMGGHRGLCNCASGDIMAC
jgi:hypothetical protein